jgi:hypothetical protein
MTTSLSMDCTSTIKIPSLDSLARIDQLFQKGNISQELYDKKDKYYYILTSKTVEDFLKTYPDYKITEDKDIVSVQWARHYIINRELGEIIPAVTFTEDRKMRQIVPQFLGQVFLTHPEAFLNETISKQIQIVEDSYEILGELQKSKNIKEFGSFLSETLSKVNLQVVANFLCSEKRGSGSFSKIANYIEILIEYR